MGTEETSKGESSPLRKVWIVNETSASNPRLAESLSQLSAALHLKFELVEQEAWIGRYNGDILADDPKSDAAIVIEHHSDETYHYQLGHVLTCAENYNARTLIWIADNFREEHRAALDWLNRWTPAEIEVYGVEIHTTEAEGSDANLKFVPVIVPASWSKSGEIPKVHSIVLRELFQKLADDLHCKGCMDKQKVLTTRYHSFPSGISNITYSACFEIDGNAWVYIPGGTANLGALRKTECRQQIRDELDLDPGTSIDWRTNFGSLGVYRKGSLNDSEQELEDIRKWMFHYLLKFKKVFNPRMEKAIAELENGE